MSQHVYTLKFTISIHNPESGTYLYGSESHATKPEVLTQEKEDILKAKIEKKIKEITNIQQGIILVKFDSLIED